MTKILLHGALGRMGRMVTERSADYDVHIVAGVDAAVTNLSANMTGAAEILATGANASDNTIVADASANASGMSTTEMANASVNPAENAQAGQVSHTVPGINYPVYATLADVSEDWDVLLDFSTAAAFDALADFLEAKRKPAVICTTGFSETQTNRVETLAKDMAVLRSGNMSMGINTLLSILKSISPALTAAGFDVEILEKHHRNKLDAPSGTAVMLADAVKESCGTDYDYVYGRSDRRSVRPKAEIGISSIRGGSIVGEHSVIFAGTDEVIEIKHTADSRAVFVNGALNAVIFLKECGPGLYSMADVIDRK